MRGLVALGVIALGIAGVAVAGWMYVDLNRTRDLPAPPTGGSDLHIRAAKRAERFVDGSVRLDLRDPAQDVVLLVELAGISVDDFNATPDSGVFLMVGERRLDPSFRTAGDWQRPDGTGVEEDRWIVAIVPRDARSFSLHFGEHGPLPVLAETAIASTLP